MGNIQIKKATRQNKKVKIALIGIAGSGKTYSALAIAKGLGDKVLVIDTEHGSASAYAEFDFDTIELDSFAPATYVECIRAAETNGYDVVILDSLSHAWSGKDGALEMVDKAGRRSQSGNSFGAWRDVTPQHNDMVEAIVGAKCHVIATLRAKTEYIVEQGKNGKSAPRKVGLAPVQRDGMEYEFDLVATIDQDHQAVVTKSRIRSLSDQVIDCPGAQVAQKIQEWLATAEPEVAPAPTPQPVRNSNTHLVEEYEKLRVELADKGGDWSKFPDVNQNMKSEVLERGLKKLRDAIAALTPSPIAQKFEDAKQGDPGGGEKVFDGETKPEEAPAPEKKEQPKHLTSLILAAEKAALPMTPEMKPLRIAAFNGWAKTNGIMNGNATVQITSFSELAAMPPDISIAARRAIIDKDLEWGVDEADPFGDSDVVEGEEVPVEATQ